MGYPSINNCKISNQNQGGGNKCQGLVPITNKSSNITNLINSKGIGGNRKRLFFVNQLGGIGRNKSSFLSNADGNCKMIEGQNKHCHICRSTAGVHYHYDNNKEVGINMHSSGHMCEICMRIGDKGYHYHNINCQV